MKKLAFVLVSLLASAPAGAQTPKYPPLSEFMMPQEAEIALARSAAPDNVSSRASIKIFTTSGFKVAVEGDNGFVCTVLRGWAAPTYGPVQFRDYVYVADLRAPICFDAVSARTMMPYYELRHKLGMEGKGPDEIARGIGEAYERLWYHDTALESPRASPFSTVGTTSSYRRCFVCGLASQLSTCPIAPSARRASPHWSARSNT
jgi:hypothetical protein